MHGFRYRSNISTLNNLLIDCYNILCCDLEIDFNITLQNQRNELIRRINTFIYKIENRDKRENESEDTSKESIEIWLNI